ncbi:MAG TPA: phosphoglucosamine mutase [Candidatus Polarisedimenticolaceae bacterium]|nr:phosphoglucosamine mutase [Candidatus Polarisedimenticolaceae bacterium]
MKRLFGTDGIRGVAGSPPLDPPTVRKFGLALAAVLTRELSHAPRVVVGRDTRESGPWIRDAVADGLASRGASAVDAGVITTPGLAYATHAGLFDAGVMISASHNPFEDNGLKVFGSAGVKIADEVEARIESLILDAALQAPPAGTGRATEDGSLVRRYIESLERLLPRGRFAGLRLLLDCANGAAAGIAPPVFRHLGAAVDTLGDAPNGRNINLDCGSLHLDGLASRMSGGGFDLGLAFDGDADRCLAVDRTGRFIDGDHILFLCGRGLKRRGSLVGDSIVATIMSNFWLEKRLAQEGIRLHRAPVGDKYVLERMVTEDAVLGGEQSGHVIFRDRGTTGDGIMTGLMLLDAVLEDGDALETTMDGIAPYPQLLVNVRVKDKPDLRAHPAIGPVVAAVEREIGDRGRVVLRYSGTEGLARVMVEADDHTLVKNGVDRISAVIREYLG